MSNNTRHALGIVAGLSTLTNTAIKAAAKKAFKTVLERTYQDSGQAAFNWKFSINNPYERQRFVYRKGRGGVVGFRNEHRTESGEAGIVVQYRLQEFVAALNSTKKIESVILYNPIPGAYSANAGLEAAATVAVNPDILDAEIAGALRGRL